MKGRSDMTPGGLGMLVEDAWFAYGGARDRAPVISALNLSIEPSQIVGIVGPNGAGKSTLLRLMGRVVVPSRGRVLLEETGGDGKNRGTSGSGSMSGTRRLRDLRSFSRKELARRIAAVLQDPPVEFGFSCLEMVLMGRTPHLGRFQGETPLDIETAVRAMELTGVSHLAERLAMQVSSGEYQRVMMARALAQEPSLLLLDEPTAHLDIAHQIDVFELMVRLRTEKGLTVVAVLHDLNQAAEYCDAVVLLKEGGIFAMGKSDRVFTAENIKSVYGAEVLVEPSPTTGRPMVIPLRNSLRRDWV